VLGVFVRNHQRSLGNASKLQETTRTPGVFARNDVSFRQCFSTPR